MKSSGKYPFLRVGVTGGIGSGKSTVCALFSDLCRHIIFADAIARKIVDEDPEAKQKIRNEFGDSAYLSTGLLDRKGMASLVFANPDKRKKLDSIVHPKVFSSIDAQIESLPAERSHPYVLIEAALIFETGMEKSLDYVIVVAANQEVCIQRVVERDKVSSNEVRRRIAAQMPMTKKIKQADFVIQNNGGESELRPAVLLLDGVLSKIALTRLQ